MVLGQELTIQNKLQSARVGDIGISDGQFEFCKEGFTLDAVDIVTIINRRNITS